GDSAVAAGGFAIAHPRVVLYSGDTCADQGADSGFRGRSGGGDRAPGGAGERATPAAAGDGTYCWNTATPNRASLAGPSPPVSEPTAYRRPSRCLCCRRPRRGVRV